MTARINALNTRLDLGEGRTGGKDASVANMARAVGLGFTAIGALIAVIGLYLAFSK